ncbi:two-component system response regulator [Tahibacter amnicola]|uniref:EAL domain-containing protein n=1 Tax=Tahibacter amnicola TaxID=2976241 RepID=A0ABY6BED9_9GAMM|nr:GGDEF domain-containing response regulator [Tahibacter amnicola]UXI66715.1 EAL domain-containing protein [Tahibacter amnicola]
MNRVLLLEPSATRRRALRSLLIAKGFEIAEVGEFGQALDVLHRLADSATGINALVFGWPGIADSQADELLALLRQDEFEHLCVVLLADSNDDNAVNWLMKRPGSALLLWSDYSECGDALAKLLAPAPSERPHLEVGGQSHLRVLFVDDSATVRIAFRRLLMKQGYLVETAEDVEDGWRKALASPFDIAIVDYFMPGDPGPVLVRRLKEDPRTSGILTATITGTYSDRVINESLAAGALECLFKSEARELFLARLGSLARAVQDRQSVDAERRRLQSILSSVGDGVYGVDPRGNIQFVNPAALDILGFDEAAELIGRSAHELFHYAFEDGTPIPRASCFLSQAYALGSQVPGWQSTFWTRARRPLPVECTVYPLNLDGRCEGSVIAFRDISSRRMLEEELRWQASHDALTKLKNRAWFETQLEQEILRLRRSDQLSLLLFLDLDRFKYINDTAGHTAGDHLLIDMSRRLSGRLRGSDHLARMGGDEYAVILRNVNMERITQIADDFRRAIVGTPFVYGGKSYRVGVSIGVAVLDQQTPSRTEAMSNADIALHMAKRHGRNQVHVFSHDADQRTKMDLELGWSARLEEALRLDQFVLCYQPVLPMSQIDYESLPDQHGALWARHIRRNSSQRVFYEALIRLREADGNLVAPAAFLPAAERFSLVGEVDRWVIRNALKALREFQSAEPPVGISINISAQSVSQPDLARYITDRLVEFDVDPRAVVFEITETGALNNLDAARNLITELRTFGCRFALDDFGVGFSSFTHLKHLDVDMLKIDGSFTQGLLSDPVDLAVISAITSIAHSVGKLTVAEYVDRPEILRALRNCGVDFAQGFYVGRPKAGLRAAGGQLEIVGGHDNIAAAG